MCSSQFVTDYGYERTSTCLAACTALYGEMGKENPAIIHIINLVTSVGSFAGPLVISPFLSDSTNVTEPSALHNNMALVSQNNITQSHPKSPNNLCSDVVYGFFIIASVGAPVAVFYILGRGAPQDQLLTTSEKVQENVGTVNKTDVMFLLLMTLFMSICVPMTFVYAQFLPTFGIYCKLYESTTRMAYMAMSYFACMMFGRVLGTLISLITTQLVLLNICAIGGIFLAVSLVFVSEINSTWLWVGTSILSVMGGPIFPAGQAWSFNVSKHDRILCGIACIGDMAGYCVMSLLTGQLMALVFVQMLNYIMVTVSLLQLLLLTLSYLTVRLGTLDRQKSSYSTIGGGQG